MPLIQNKKLFMQFFIILFLITIPFKFSQTFRLIIELLGSVFVILKLSYVLVKQFQTNFAVEKISVLAKQRTGAALITGCDSGFGNRLAFRLNAMGFRVYATVLDKSSLGAMYLDKNCKFTDRLKILPMNVTKQDDINKVFKIIERELINNNESLCALVNNAGVTHVGHVDWGRMDAYQSVIGINTFGTVAVTLRFLPIIKHSKGKIINMSSVNGRMTFPKTGPYCMSKHAITSFTDALRRELREWGVDVTTIEPAFYRTPLLADNNYKRVMDREWERTDNAVKQVYGQKYFDSMDRMAKNVDFFVGNNIDEVVDNIINAITRPTQSRYLTISGFCIKFLIYLGERAPAELFDTVYSLIERFNFGFEKIEK